MLLITISAVWFFAESTKAGYIYPRPSITFNLPKVEPNFEDVFTPKIVQDFTPKQTTENVVSYYVPPQSDNLSRYVTNLHSNNLHESKANGLRLSPLATANLQVNSLANTFLSQQNIATESTSLSDLLIPENHKNNVLLDIPTAIRPENNFNFDSVENTDISNVELQNNVELTTNQLVENSNLNGLSNAQTAVAPKITKHIYFHVPPPEIEEPVVHYVPPKKKVYKIIFIKVPSQERRGISQGNVFNQVGPIEQRTIIYVLSKKPSQNQEVFLPKPVPSQHEVFFVKYNGNSDEAVNQINDNLEQPLNLLQATRLQAGELNGKR